MAVKATRAPIVIFLALLCWAGVVLAERDTVDKIVVIVGDQVILASEVANQMQMVAFQREVRPETEEEVQAFQMEVLEQMVSDRLFLIEAKKDTTIVVRQGEVDQALNDQIARVASNFNSQEEFLQGLAQEGMTLRDLERQYESEIRNNLLRQRYIQGKLYGVSVSRYEVEQFYSKFQDSIPEQPEAAKLAHVLLQVKPSTAVEDSVRAKVAGLRKQILEGADFATVATEHSTHGAGANGGDLGYIHRDDVVPEFARAAFNLSVGDVSGVIRTQFGFHVIKCEGTRGDRLRLRHLLVGVTPTGADTARTIRLADSLLALVRDGADFAETAKIFSSDDDTRAQGGELGWFALESLPQEFVSTVIGWKTPDEIRGPLSTRFGIHLLKLLEYQKQKKLSLDDSYDQVKEMARQDKTGKLVDEWIGKIKDKTYIEYRLDN